LPAFFHGILWGNSYARAMKRKSLPGQALESPLMKLSLCFESSILDV
jgi:hypothetical protein